MVRRIIWFESPEEALSDPVRFMAYAMASATHEDMKVIRRYVDNADFLEALDKAPPGIIDPRLGVLEFADGALSDSAPAGTAVGMSCDAEFSNLHARSKKGKFYNSEWACLERSACIA